MTTLKVVKQCLERIVPLRLAEKWDNVGLLLESPIHRQNANRILLTIDLTPPVLNEILQTPTSIVVSYHPTIFKPISSFTLANPLHASLLTCAAHGISVYSPHTACDSVWGGVNDWLVEAVAGGQDVIIDILGKRKFDEDGVEEGGEGRVVTFHSPIAMRELEARVKQNLQLSQIQVGYPNRPPELISNVAICAGSGGSMLLGHDADVYLTGEMSHHEVLAAVAAGKHVILCGHTNTERGYLPKLAAQLRAELQKFQNTEAFASYVDTDQDILRQLEVHVSVEDRHPLQFV